VYAIFIFSGGVAMNMPFVAAFEFLSGFVVLYVGRCSHDVEVKEEPV